MAERLGVAPDKDFVENFVEWRSEAERRARRRSSREEIRLDEIWAELKTLIGGEMLAGIDGPALELEAERATLSPIQMTRARIAELRALGRGILFISDSYLPASFLAPLLHSHGFASEGDPIYISSEIGLTKHSGALFTHVLKSEKLQPSQLYHIGDNPLADVSRPARLGIHTELFTESRRNPTERLLLWQRPVENALWIATAGDLVATRLSSPQNTPAPTPLDKLVQQFLGPFLCVFGHWLLRKAAADGMKRLYFASRDTRLLWTVCQNLARPEKQRMDLRYLLVSRQALMLPSISEISPEALAWLQRDHGPATLPRLLEKFELNYDDWTEDWLQLHPAWRPETPVESSMDWAVFWRFLDTEKIRRKILENAAIRRRHARDYFSTQGLLDSIPAGFVDLGWFLTCQGGLNRIRTDSNPLPALKGYYLGLKCGRLGPAEAGKASALFKENAEDLPGPSHLAWLRRNYLIDQIAGLADHPSVHAYGPEGRVEFTPDSATLSTATFQHIEKSLVAYASTYGACWQTIADDDTQIAVFLSTLLNRFFEYPSPSCVSALQGIVFTPNQGSSNSERLIEPYSWSDMVRSLFSPVSATGLKKPPDWRWWPEASAVATPRLQRLFHRGTRVLRKSMS